MYLWKIYCCLSYPINHRAAVFVTLLNSCSIAPIKNTHSLLYYSKELFTLALQHKCWTWSVYRTPGLHSLFRSLNPWPGSLQSFKFLEDISLTIHCSIIVCIFTNFEFSIRKCCSVSRNQTPFLKYLLCCLAL